MDQKLIKKEPLGNGFFVNVSPHHTFGTDAVLLSHFAKPKNKDKLVDLGTGCGIIPLIMLREGKLSKAVGVDISEEATFLAQKTVSELNLENFEIITQDIGDGNILWKIKDMRESWILFDFKKRAQKIPGPDRGIFCAFYSSTRTVSRGLDSAASSKVWSRAGA